MRRVITTLAILFVVIVAGMTALVLLVNPNDFRSYMVQQVEQRSGYKLTLEGDLRWHVWPQLSILSGRMSIAAPGAQQPLVKAENMRLDVHLLPLLSHQLSVKQVMLKNAVIRLTPESEAQRQQNAPIGPADSSPAEPVAGWKFDIGNLNIVDSLLIWQQAGGEQFNFRALNLDLAQSDRKRASVEFSTLVNRDQRELRLALKGEMDITEYPHQLTGKIDELNYQLKGADLPVQGMQGKASMAAEWLNDAQRFSLKDIALSANESQLSGAVSGRLGPDMHINVDMHSPKLDLDALLGIPSGTGAQNSPTAQAQVSGRAPVIAQAAGNNHRDSLLNTMKAELKLQADALRWRGMDLHSVKVAASNDNGLITLTSLDGNAGSGAFSVPGTVDIRSAQTQVAFKPVLRDIELAPLLKALDIPETLSGKLSLTGDLRGNGLSVRGFRHQWQGRADLTMESARLAGLNFQQMVQQAVERSSDRVRGTHSEASDTEIQQLKGSVQLNNGKMSLDKLQGRSSMLDLTGQGAVDLVNQQCDVTFNVKVINGWQGDSALVQSLTQTAIPLRFYGPWGDLKYSLKVDQALRKRLQEDAKTRLNRWVEHNRDDRKAEGMKRLLKEP